MKREDRRGTPPFSGFARQRGVEDQVCGSPAVLRAISFGNGADVALAFSHTILISTDRAHWVDSRLIRRLIKLRRCCRQEFPRGGEFGCERRRNSEAYRNGNKISAARRITSGVLLRGRLRVACSNS